MKIFNKRDLSLIIWVVVLLLAGSLMGALTKSSVDSWYLSLNRSPLSPANYLFSIVWSILYLMIAISGWWMWRACHSSRLSLLKILYGLQLLLNWSWTPLFFRYQLIGIALICLLTIVVLVGIIIIKSYYSLKLVSWLLFPYFLWLLFASYLNFYIYWYN